ncbi:MAG: hypothetical protein R3194_08645, partial [Limnobacter sp.]|nr:hypothetical protein [Limnobacter sp.]
AEHHKASPSEAPAPSVVKVAPMPERGQQFEVSDVFNFNMTKVCRLPEGANPILCQEQPLLTAIPADQTLWQGLAAQAVKSFMFGFGQTDYASKSPSAPVALNYNDLLPQVIRNGVGDQSLPNYSKTLYPKQNYETITYDAKICSQGGRVRVRMLDQLPLGELSVGDAFSIGEVACVEPGFTSSATFLTSMFSDIRAKNGESLSVVTKGQMGRQIGAKQYAGSVLELEQDILVGEKGSTITYRDGAVGHCGTALPGTIDWDKQCLETGVVMDGLRLTKQISAKGVNFPGVSYIAFSQAGGVTADNQPVQNKFELVGNDVQIAHGANHPTGGMLTLVGSDGHKVRLQFGGSQVKLTRFDVQGNLEKEITMPTATLIQQ